jgi:hypothetical protein
VSTPAVAAVSDGSAFAGTGSLDDALARCAAWISDLSGLPVCAAAVPEVGTEGWLRAVPSGVGAVFVTHTDSQRARRPWIAAPCPVLVDDDVTAVTLTAGVLTALARDGLPVSAGRVLIACLSTPPSLPVLLIAAGVRHLTIWNACDRDIVPFTEVVDDADVVVNLVGAAAGGAVRGRSRTELALVSPHAGRVSRLVAAGLLGALARNPRATVSVDVLEACALAVVSATPPARPVPVGADQALAGRITDAATRAFRPRSATERSRPVHG